MASVRSTIELVITGATRGLGAAAAEARRMAERVAEAEDRVTEARRRQAEASSRVAEAEARLNRARQSGDPNAIAAASERLARARGQEFAASENLARAEARLQAVRRRGTDDINRQRDGILGLFDAFNRLGQAFSGADGASTSLLSKLSALNSVIGSIGGPIVQAVVGLVEFAAILGAIGEIVGVLGGLVGQALAGIPVLLLAIGAAAGTVALGLEGIKKAAEVLQPAFQQLQRDVSEVFVRQLTPAFRDLAAAIPKLTDGFRFIAVSLSGIAAQVISFVTSAKGIATINGILRGTATLFSSMAPGIRAFTQGLLEAANVGKPAFEALGTAIGSVFQKIGEVFSRLAADGTIARAVQGLAATLTGLGAVVAPLIELFIRMGAALGDSLGTALQGVGAGITQVIPFFEKLAQVAGTILVDAFNQLGPPLRELVNSILPGAGSGMDGFARLMHDVVLPAIAGFINFLRTDGIPAISAFFRGLVFQASSFAASFLRSFDVVLAALSGFFKTLAVLTAGTPLGKMFLDAAAATEGFRTKVQGLAATMETVRNKQVTVTVNAQGKPVIEGLKTTIDGVRDKVVKVTSSVFGTPDVVGLKDRMAEVNDKTVTTTANVPSSPTLGTLGNQTLTGAIGAVINKTVATTANVPGSPTMGTQGNQALTGAINNVISKTVSVVANVSGESAVRSLINAISNVVSKTVNIVANVIGNPFGLRAKGGPVAAGGTYLVGEKGPELLTIGSTSGFVTDASRTRQILRGPKSGQAQKSSTEMAAPADQQPITVNVMLSQEQIAGIAQVEIARRDRATRRTVLAGSGVTF